jgi:hypothetical protein
MRGRFGSILVLCVVLWCSAAGAIQRVRSLYTAIDIGKCRTVAGQQSSARVCAGLPGYPVYVAEGASAVYLSIGRDAAQRRAAQQTLKSFNTLFHVGGRSTVEWRFVVRNQRTVPYATIVRYFTQNSAGAGEVLVVTRVTPEEACHVAYIDALANADAIVLARKVADTAARNAPCPEVPAVHGAAGRSPM